MTVTMPHAFPHRAESDDHQTKMCTCPVCGAAQVWSDTCRRCQVDLSELRRAFEETQHLKKQLRALVKDGEWFAVYQTAERLEALQPNLFHAMVARFVISKL